jgi:hypothetical protein
MGCHQKLGIYVSYETSSIIKYLEPMTGDLHMTQHSDCIFDKKYFLALGGERHPEECREIVWNTTRMHSLYPHTSESKLSIQRIIYLQNLADASTDHKRVTMSHIPAVNASKRVQVPQKVTNCVVSSKLRKRGRPLGAPNKVQRRRPHRQGPEPLASLKDSVEESQPTVENIPEDTVPIKIEPLKWQLNLKLRWYLPS